jgi:hypothetical protein
VYAVAGSGDWGRDNAFAFLMLDLSITEEKNDRPRPSSHMLEMSIKAVKGKSALARASLASRLAGGGVALGGAGAVLSVP